MSAHLKMMSASKTDDAGQRVNEVIARRAPPRLLPSATAVLKMLAAVPDNGGLTANELAELLALTSGNSGNAHHQIRTLKDAGKVVPGETSRIPDSHCYATLWRLAT